MYMEYQGNNLTYTYSQKSPYIGALEAWIEGKIENFRDNNMRSIPSYGFVGQSLLEEVILPQCTIIKDNAFYNCISLQSLYLLTSSVCTLSNSNAFYSTPIENSTYTDSFGSIYVPASLVNSYKAAENWSYYSNRITAF